MDSIALSVLLSDYEHLTTDHQGCVAGLHLGKWLLNWLLGMGLMFGAVNTTADKCVHVLISICLVLIPVAIELVSSMLFGMCFSEKALATLYRCTGSLHALGQFCLFVMWFMNLGAIIEGTLPTCPSSIVFWFYALFHFGFVLIMSYSSCTLNPQLYPPDDTTEEEEAPPIPGAATQDELDRLFTQRIGCSGEHRSSSSDTSISSESGEEECTICLRTYKDRQRITILPCCHKFHSACINQWFKRSNRCPLCKQCLSEGESVFHSSGEQQV